MTIVEQVYWLVILSIVVASLSWTVTQEEIFSEWREGCNEKSQNSASILKRKFFYVFTCEYCFSHWVALGIIALTGFWVLLDDWRGYILAFFLLSWIANQWMSLYRRLRIDIKHENLKADVVEHEKENMEREAKG